ncbi:MAG TPA: 3-oxoacyl-ACP reductase FabG [Polyangiaceae bacterium LLY-WYZ-15_(1-7)]|nr:3-oxoacyl-ACP reductase FabG [Myxococcales bacterium]MAT27835.1 3-oxoacyl-ACP reductase FabG [Sandaracinus sp.]HJK93895.1 3-oxoacyl-ACP reductase FabG [Polyangiaceae bacterium LLY-WYZ-15_(1-7)]MBJ71271.1 3-oxoacyl-ACP reductase FabG [Sandaracinus sp.]HJL05845.1 3-oxoacyl-ACP reductase FabG [Polyangiaceae bacterium LLY-WYZ-15_(1-7)]
MSKPHALVTGGSRGIGAAICHTLAAAGHPILLNYRSNDAAAEEVKAAIEADGGQVTLLKFDVTDREASGAALEKLIADEVPVGVLVNNAGIAKDASFPQMSWEQWESVTRTTLDGFFNVTRPLVMPMVRRRWGRIINISSVSGVDGNRGQVNYAAAKAGLIGATKSLAQEVAKRGVTVNAIAPGLVETDMIEDAPVDIILKHIPMRRVGKPEEVASLVGWLASDLAGYITGQVVVMSGGL